MSHLCTAGGGQQFRKEWRKFQRKITFERYYSFFRYCLLSYRYVMFQKRILSKSKWEGTSSGRHDPPSRAPVATGLVMHTKNLVKKRKSIYQSVCSRSWQNGFPISGTDRS